MPHVRNAPARGPRPIASPLFDVGDVYAGIWGQSNAIGRAERSEISSSPLSSDPGLETYDAGTFSRVYIYTGSAFAQLQPSSNNQAEAGQFGPEFGLAVRWMRETSAGNLYIHKLAGSGVPIANFQPYVWPGTDIWAAAAAAISWLASNGHAPDAKSWVWIQGESDNDKTQTYYQTRLQEIVDAIRAEGVVDASSRLVIAQQKVGSTTYSADVDAAKAAVAAGDPTNIKLIRMDYYYVDGVHTNGRGQVQTGYDAFEKIFDAPHIST